MNNKFKLFHFQVTTYYLPFTSNELPFSNFEKKRVKCFKSNRWNNCSIHLKQSARSLFWELSNESKVETELKRHLKLIIISASRKTRYVRNSFLSIKLITYRLHRITKSILKVHSQVWDILWQLKALKKRWKMLFISPKSSFHSEYI